MKTLSSKVLPVPVAAILFTASILAALVALPGQSALAATRTVAPRPVPEASPSPRPRPASVGRLLSRPGEFPADPHNFPRTHAAPHRSTKGALAHHLLKRSLRIAPISRGRGTRGAGPSVVPGALDPRNTPKNVGAVVVAYMARQRSTPAPSPTPVTLSRQRITITSRARRPATVDVTSQNVTGINHWWSYEEGTIPGVGRWMINANAGNLIVQADDVDVPHRGIDLAFRRTYNSFSRHDFWGSDGATEIGQYGGGWTNTFDAHLSTNGCPNNGYAYAGFYGFSVHDVDGARYDYCFNAAGQLIPPTGMQGTSLAVNPDGGSFYWTKKNGTQYTFYAPYYGGTSAAYSGRIYRISGRNQNNYIQLTYAWSPDASSSANLTTITAATDNGGSQATLSFASFNGQVLLSQLTRPDGAVITYSYDADGELVAVAKPPPNSSGTPVTETYNGYQSFLMVAGPRWNAGGENDGGYVAFEMDETTTSQVDGIEWAGVMNFAPGDGTNTLLQPSVATGPIVYRWEGVSVHPTYTAFTDTDGHSFVQYVDASGRPTVRQEYTGSQWLSTSEGWDASNDLTSTVDARGFESDYAYDANGNTIAVAQPQTTTSVGTFRPTSLYDYDPVNNVTAYCDPTETHTAQADWTSAPAASDSLCSSHAVPHATFAFAYPSYAPFGQLTAITTPMGYHRTIAYGTSQQGGADFGLPTSVRGDAYTQLDGTTVTPSQTLWYDASGYLRCYSKGVGTYVLSYDALGRLTSEADPDDSSANNGSVCGKTSGTAGWNTQTTSTYYPDGSKQSSRSPSERAYGVSTTYTYDLDRNDVTDTTHHGCVSGQSCPDGTTKRWYDGADRLVEVVLPQDPRAFIGTDPGPYDTGPSFTRYLYDLSGGSTVTVGTSAPFQAYGNLYETVVNAASGTAPAWLEKAGSQFDALDREVAKFSWLIPSTLAGSYTTTILTTQLKYDQDSTTFGLLSTKITPAGESITYAYDPAGRVKSKSYAGDGGRTPNETYVFDPLGRAASITSSQFGTQSYGYDFDGRLTTSTEPALGGLTDPAQIQYAYYADGQRSAVSVSSQAFTQANALTYSYRADGKLQTKAINAFSSGTWTRQYTDAGRLLSEGGVGSRTRTYDATGQLVNDTVHGTPITYARDPEGSPNTETYPSYASSTGGPMGVAFTYNVRGELVDTLVTPVTPSGLEYRAEGSGICTSREKIPLDGSYGQNGDPQLPTFDQRTCAIRSSGFMGGTVYNGTTYQDGSTNKVTYDLDGRAMHSVTNTATFFAPTSDTLSPASVSPNEPPPTAMGPNPYNGDASNGTSATPDPNTGSGGTPSNPKAGIGGTGSGSTRSTAGNEIISVKTVDTLYDAENRTVSRSGSVSRTVTPLNQGATPAPATSYPTAPGPSIGWGPNGHPVLAYSGTSASLTFHWDGDLILFATDVNGNVVDFKAGVDGEVTPRDANWTGLTVFDRDDAGTTINAADATYTMLGVQSPFNCFMPLNGLDGSVTTNYPMCVPQYAPYYRGDGFYIGDIQINGVRAYDAATGTWTTPDAYEGDVHDPMSQQKYMFNRNDPVDYSDPSGYNPLVVTAGAVAAGTVLDLAGDLLIVGGAAAGGALLHEHAAHIRAAARYAAAHSADSELEDAAATAQLASLIQARAGLNEKRSHIPGRVRKQVMGEKGTNCAYGGCPTTPEAGHDNSLELDHITPVSRGGGNDPCNLQPTCRKHNRGKSNKTDEEYRKQLEQKNGG